MDASSASAIDAASRAPASLRLHIHSRGARDLRDHMHGHRCTRHIDDAQPRPSHAQPVHPGGAREQQSGRTDRIPLCRGRRASVDIASSAPDALPRHALRQHLGERTGHLDCVGIEHTVASRRHRVAGIDPGGRRRQRQRRIGGRADQIIGA